MSVIQSATKTNFAAINDALTMDVTNLNSVRFEFVGTYNFTAVFEALGIDGATWYPFQMTDITSATIVTQHSTVNATQAYIGNCAMIKKVRVRLTAFTSAGVHSVGIAAADTASVVSSPDVQTMAIRDRLDSVNDAITTYPLGHNVTVISTAATTTIKTGTGVIRHIRVIGGTLGNVTAYDNTAGSGTLLVPTVTPAAGQILLEDAAFTTGLTIVTAAATLLAVTWR